MNVILTGFMGTGKSTVGRRLAAQLGWAFVDTDHLIEQRHGPIPQIFEDRGEEAFRAFEREVATDLAQHDHRVISTGGRLMLDPQASDALSASGRVFCLSADVEELTRRLLSSIRERPLLSADDPEATIRSLLAERAEGYAEFEQVDTTDRSPAEIADDIVARIRP